MASDFDRRFDDAIATLTAPGALLSLAVDAHGRAIPAALPATLGGYIDAFTAQHAAAEAVVSGDERLTFADIAAAANRLAHALAGGHGIVKGDRVAIAMRNAPAWIVAYIAVVKAGGIAVLINGWWQPSELAHALDLTDPVLVIADPERARRAADAGWTGKVVTLPVDLPIDQALAPLIEGAEPGALPQVDPEDDATILFTSGSTGLAKGAVSTHRAVTTATYNFALYTYGLYTLLVGEGRPPAFGPAALIAVPMFHVTGAIPVMLTSFALGRKMVLLRKWDAGEALRLVEAERITYFVGVPTMSYEMMLHPDRTTRDLASLSDIAAGGAPRPVAHVPRLAEAFPGGNPMMGYGLTETNAVGCTNCRSSYIARPASTGRAQPGFVEIAILDDDGARLPAGTVGEIAIRSAANIRGYWRNPEATAAAFTADGWFRTADLGYLDDEGYLFIVDRAKDIIIRGGENISCTELESAIYACPAVSETAAFALPDERLGEVPGVVVYRKPGSPLEASELIAFLEPTLARYKLPERVWFSDAPLPKLGTGKIDKAALRTHYRAVMAGQG